MQMEKSNAGGEGRQSAPERTVMQEKKPRRRVAVPLDRVVGRSRDQLSAIGSKLTRAVFPLSSLPEKRHHQQIAHAITAISLAQGILRDVEANRQ
jgi:hypothetical protein